MPAKRKPDDMSREEDFRDYDDRNIDGGWPYEDASGRSAGQIDNNAYGESKGNFDSDLNQGYRVDEADFDGMEEPVEDTVRPATKGLEEADDLEERITDAIEELDDIDMASIDVHVEDCTVTIEGGVDDAATSRKIARRIQAVEGVKSVVNNLRLEGVDSRIPDDD